MNYYKLHWIGAIMTWVGALFSFLFNNLFDYIWIIGMLMWIVGIVGIWRKW